MYADFDLSEFPLVVVEFTGERADDDNFSEYLAKLDELYESKDDFVIVFDARNASVPALKYQKQQGAWLREHQEKIQKHCIATAYVIVKSSMKIVLEMIFLVYPQPVPYKIFLFRDEAEEWARKVLNQKSNIA